VSSNIRAQAGLLFAKALACAFLLAGCANIPKENIYDSSLRLSAASLNVAAITVRDESTTRSRPGFTMGLGFEAMVTSTYDPTPGMMLRDYSRRVLHAAGERGTVEVTIQSADFYIKRELEDRMPIVNIFAFGRTLRPYMCDAVVKIAGAGIDQTETVRSVTPIAGPTDFRNVIARCQLDLARQIGERLSSMMQAQP
jgi:hypothetical protein